MKREKRNDRENFADGMRCMRMDKPGV